MSLGDERKNLLQKAGNFLTGVKTGTYDLEKLRLADLQKANQRDMAKYPMISEMTNYYVPVQRRGDPGATEALRRVKTRGAILKELKKIREKRDREKAAQQGAM
jgi:hypothetical protein